MTGYAVKNQTLLRGANKIVLGFDTVYIDLNKIP